jgi:hypothetical protein
VELGSRKERPLTRYFPELVAAVKAHLPTCCVVDAEIVVPDPEGRRLDWDALLLRIHPAASRVALLASQTRPAWSPSTCWRWGTRTGPASRSPAAAPPWRTPSPARDRRST